MFFAYLKQGDGCGYTIGCGRKLLTLESTNREAAIEELKNAIIEEYDEDLGLEEVFLIEGTKDSMPLESWYREYNEQKKAKARNIKEKEEKDLFEKLKAKYEGSKQ